MVNDPVRSVRFEAGREAATLLSAVPLNEVGVFMRLMTEYRTGLSQTLDMPSTQTELGNMHLDLGKVAQAETAYRRALGIEPHYLPALLNLGDLYRAMGAEDEARENLQRAIEIAPDSSAANHSYGLALVRQGETRRAIPYFRTAFELPDSVPRYAYVYAVALDSLARTDHALTVLSVATLRWPNQVDLLRLQAGYLQKSERTGELKQILIDKLNDFLKNHQKEREKAKKKLKDFIIKD